MKQRYGRIINTTAFARLTKLIAGEKDRIVIGGEDFGHGEPGSGGHLFFGSAAEGVEVKRMSPGTDEVEAFDAGF